MAVLQGSVYPAELIAGSDLTGSTVTCTVTAPDLTVSTVTPTVEGTVATANVPATQVGTYLIVWGVSGPTAGAQQDQFSCIAPVADLISLSDLRDELSLNTTAKDDKLRAWLRAANDVIENVTGPIRPHTVTDMFDGGRQVVVLNDMWVQSITSITEYWGRTPYLLTEQALGASTTPYGYTWDRDTNAITRRDASGYVAYFTPGPASVVAVYRAGLAVIPEDIQMAAVDFVRHQYNKSRQDRTTGYGSAPQGDDSMMVGNWSVPNSMMELLEPRRRMPGIA